MTLVYDKKGVAVKVAHPIDVKGWLDDGYTLEKPKKPSPRKATTPKEK